MNQTVLTINRDGQSPQHRCIALIEDDGPLLDALTFALESEGYAILALPGGAQALDAHVALAAADCLVVDYRLAPHNGLSVIAKLWRRGVRAPAILITTDPDPHCRKAAAALGVSILEKPLLKNILSQRIGDILAARSTV